MPARCSVEGCGRWGGSCQNSQSNRKYSENTDLAMECSAASLSQLKGPNSTCGINKNPNFAHKQLAFCCTENQ